MDSDTIKQYPTLKQFAIFKAAKRLKSRCDKILDFNSGKDFTEYEYKLWSLITELGHIIECWKDINRTLTSAELQLLCRIDAVSCLA